MPGWDLESREATQRLKGPSGIICANGAEVGVSRCPGGDARQQGCRGSVAMMAQTSSQAHCSSNGLD